MYHAEWERLLSALGVEFSLTEQWLGRPSQQASQDFLKNSREPARIARWVDRISDDDKREVQGILDMFNIAVYTAFDANPRSAASTKSSLWDSAQQEM